MEVSVGEKSEQVALWLKKRCDHPFPQHQMSEETIDAFYQLVTYNEAVDENFTLLIEDMKQSATKYEEEANYLQGILTERLGISLSSLSSEGLSNIDVLVNSAMTLDTKDTSLTSFFSAISDMTSELCETELKNREMEVALRGMKKKLVAALVRENQLDKDLKELRKQLKVDKVEVKNQMKGSEFMKIKAVDLGVRMKAAKKKLAASGLKKSLTHKSLVSLSARLDEEQKELKKLQTELETYIDLPPNLSLAQVKVEEAKQELNALEEKLTAKVNNVFLKEI